MVGKEKISFEKLSEKWISQLGSGETFTAMNIYPFLRGENHNVVGAKIREWQVRGLIRSTGVWVTNERREAHCHRIQVWVKKKSSR